MKIILDAMGGDKAPLEIIRGAVMAVSEYDAAIMLVGNVEKMREAAAADGISLDNEKIECIDASEVITMEDAPLSVRTKKDSSMAVGLRLLSEGRGDAFVSAGNTGALYAGASLIVGRIKGFRKAAIATIMPFEKPALLIDSGANTVVTDENLEQFALMGSIYMERLFGIESPRVGLLNNGSEPTKGTQVLQDAYVRLRDSDAINFVGNVEGKDVTNDSCDVIVTDGFTGNVFLKLTEGLGALLLGKLKKIYKKNTLTKLSAAIIKKDITAFKKEFDASEYGGAPILGISRPVIKSHGSSDALEIKNAVRQAINYVNTGIILEIAKQSRRSDDSQTAETAAQKPGEDGNE